MESLKFENTCWNKWILASLPDNKKLRNFDWFSLFWKEKNIKSLWIIRKKKKIYGVCFSWKGINSISIVWHSSAEENKTEQVQENPPVEENKPVENQEQPQENQEQPQANQEQTQENQDQPQENQENQEQPPQEN